ncbi:unnamed protein product [Linum trigynum]|uniref:Uncharacterized protein n=1 Tax=Linum trigynum TaxID=586398 RepID=A0AAV2GNX1_9ROSI
MPTGGCRFLTEINSVHHYNRQTSHLPLLAPYRHSLPLHPPPDLVAHQATTTGLSPSTSSIAPIRLRLPFSPNTPSFPFVDSQSSHFKFRIVPQHILIDKPRQIPIGGQSDRSPPHSSCLITRRGNPHHLQLAPPPLAPTKSKSKRALYRLHHHPTASFPSVSSSSPRRRQLVAKWWSIDGQSYRFPPPIVSPYFPKLLLMSLAGNPSVIGLSRLAVNRKIAPPIVGVGGG